MNVQYRSQIEERRQLIRNLPDASPRLNGIDFIEVDGDRKTLIVHFIHPLTPLEAENILITGGTRLQNVQVESVSFSANKLIVRVDRVGDYSTYTLRLVKSAASPTPLPGFDPLLSQIDFSFWTGDISEFDCKAPEPLPEKEPPAPVIDYLAKDYASLRRLMLDRLAVTIPQWQERNPADLGIMLVEILAHAADYLSYYQDAVATEAYLGTARKRVSVRRHARLLDYLMHDGCNARAWVAIELQNNHIDGIKLLAPSKEENRSGVQFLTKTNLSNTSLSEEEFNRALNAGAEVFESLEEITLYHSLNTINFYTWESKQCYLPKGSTQATLYNSDELLHKQLKPGKVLIFEEVRGWETGEERDANPNHRHAVRLTKVESAIDPLNNQKIVEITWHVADALPFDLYISNINSQDKLIDNISVVRGNVVLVDAGRSLSSENLQENPGWERLRPRLKEGPLTQQGYVQNRQRQWELFDPTASATNAMQWELRNAHPAIALWENQVPKEDKEAGVIWEYQRDLLVSDRFARDFVVETEDDGRAYLRFGDGTLGRKPQPDTHLYACYRIGNGRAGNVGADTIVNFFIQKENLKPEDRDKITDIQTAIKTVRNPLPAKGGTEPESIEQVRLYAPQAFREQKRAVTEQDYAAAAQRYPGVQKALATRRWTGSWHTIFITVDREGGRAIDEEFKRNLLDSLEQFRLAGHDIEIDSPRFVPLDIAMTVQVKRDYFRSNVKKALLDAFSNRVLANGQLGFFSSDRFTFGESVYLSQVIAAAVQVPGVESVKIDRFQRWGEPSNRELEIGKIQFEPLEIARLDNIPNTPENGRIEFNLEGGL
ncbi:putative baseplate assembly protein [Aerosakkonemataceae cyanobacterium BLCC-F50]|uniref:Baseplate assembly protein n=1 Tax=Floridaenema flaviceps BLCC-F50 TaxID=3153642 RepID=A0ABV4XTC7_9CYAN